MASYARFETRARPNRRPDPSIRYPDYDEYRLPPALPPDFGRPGPPPKAHESPYRRVKSWPPAPRCEEENVSLAKEARYKGSSQSWSDHEAPSRGTIDQEPIIQDSPGYYNGQRLDHKLDARATPTGIPTPPTSEDEGSSNRKQRDSPLASPQQPAIPELTKRTSMPYSYTKPTKLKAGDSSSASCGRSEPGIVASERRKGTSSFDSSVQPVPENRSNSFPRSHQSEVPSNKKLESTIDDSDYDSREPVSRSHRQRPSTVRHQSVHDESVARQDFARSPRSSFVSSKRPVYDSRRMTDSMAPLSALDKTMFENDRRPKPIVVSNALGERESSPSLLLSPDLKTFSDPGNQGRANENGVANPRMSTRTFTGDRSPQRSPRMSAEGLPGHRQSGGPHSKPSSVAGSRAPSPLARSSTDSSRLSQTDPEWTSLLAANALRKDDAKSCRSSLPKESSLPAAAKKGTNTALPYPEDDFLTIPMPVEQDHQCFPDLPPVSTPYSYERSHSWQTPSFLKSSTFSSNGSATPSLCLRRSATDLKRDDARSRLDNTFQSDTVNATVRKDVARLLKTECTRHFASRDYDDWYTIIGAPDMDVCPACVDSVFERTQYRPMIRRSPPKRANERTQCALGASAWIRLAWILTSQQKLKGLDLLMDIFEIEASGETCPAGCEAVRTWYGVRDPDGLYVRDFSVCHSDVRKVERLLPTLVGFFVRLPNRASNETKSCSMHARGNRFPAYLDALIVTHEKAVSQRGFVDPMPFIRLVERKTQVRECSRDNMLLGGLWYYIPSAPALTVCEDCFETIVRPEIKNRSSVALQFNRSVQPIHGEGMGSSCQLYSARMRRAFERAVEDDDVRYLARKAIERRSAELCLQERHKTVMRRARRLSRDETLSDEDERRLQRELEKITNEWQTRWE